MNRKETIVSYRYTSEEYHELVWNKNLWMYHNIKGDIIIRVDMPIEDRFGLWIRDTTKSFPKENQLDMTTLKFDLFMIEHDTNVIEIEKDKEQFFGHELVKVYHVLTIRNYLFVDKLIYDKFQEEKWKLS